MKYLHYAVVLGLISALAALGVAGTFKMTKQRIADKARKESEIAQKKVVSMDKSPLLSSEILNPDAKEEEQVMAFKNDMGKIIAYTCRGEAQGYGGKIKVMVGMDNSAQKVIGVEVISQNETPGLGTRIKEVKASKTWVGVITGRTLQGLQDETPEFLKPFAGLRFEELQLKTSDGKGIQAITGATISSRGTINAVRNAVENIQKVCVGTTSAKQSDAYSGATPDITKPE